MAASAKLTKGPTMAIRIQTLPSRAPAYCDTPQNEQRDAFTAPFRAAPQ